MKAPELIDLADTLPPELAQLKNPQTDLPRIAKDARLTSLIQSVVESLPTAHDVHLGDARDLSFVKDESVHLVITSPPYWTLKEYRRSDGQMGYIEDYEEFLTELDKVWQHCLRALVPGGRLICVVGDVCLSRRKNEGLKTPSS